MAVGDGQYYSDGLDIAKLKLAYTKRGSLNIQSLLFTLWTNFSSLYLSFIARPLSSLEDLRRALFPPNTDKQDYCWNQMMRLWNVMPEQLHLTLDERNHLVSEGLQNIFKVSMFAMIVVVIAFYTPHSVVLMVSLCALRTCLEARVN